MKSDNNSRLSVSQTGDVVQRFLFGAVFLGLVLIAVSAFILTGTYGSAETRNASVTVSSACTMSTTGTGTYTDTITPGNYSEILGSPLNVVCNDASGYSIYAIGYSNDSYTDNNTKMIASLGSDYNISTATSGNDSWWAMKVAGSGTNTPTIDNSFSSYQQIPATYTKVSHVTNNTTNSITTPTYKVNISGTQAPGTYTGKVKYTVVHPNNADAPETPATFTWQDSTATRPADADVKFAMQDFDTTICSQGTNGQIGWVKDSRDGTVYTIGKLADGKCWMLDNLALDITNSTILNGLTTTNTNVDAASLTSLKSGNRSAGSQYASSGFAVWNSSNTSSVYNQAKANADSKDIVPSNAPAGGLGSNKVGVYYNYCAASAGSYCYDGGAGTGNASYDLCPAGWRMPTSGSSGEYRALYNQYSSASEGQVVAFRNALSTPLSGSFNSGSASNQGSRGFFWSSTYYNSDRMYGLGVYSSSVYPSSDLYRIGGIPLRCIRGSS